MKGRKRLTFLGWTLPKETRYIKRDLPGDEGHEAFQHEGDKLKAYLKVRKLIPRYQRS
jgi:hypothetical protein